MPASSTRLDLRVVLACLCLGALVGRWTAPSGWACEDAVFDQHGDPKIYARAEVDPAPAGDAPRRARPRANANRRRRRPRGDSRAHAAPVRVPGGHGDDRVVGARARSNAVRVRGVVPRASARPSRGPEKNLRFGTNAGARDAETRRRETKRKTETTYYMITMVCIVYHS